MCVYFLGTITLYLAFKQKATEHPSILMQAGTKPQASFPFCTPEEVPKPTINSNTTLISNSNLQIKLQHETKA